MTFLPRRHQIQKNATLTVSGNSGVLPNLGRSENPTVIVMVDVQGPVTGTTPSLVVSLWASTDSNRLSQVGTPGAAITAVIPASTGPQRLVFHDVLEDNIEVQWAITGTTPSFGGVNIDVIFTSPDA